MKKDDVIIKMANHIDISNQTFDDIYVVKRIKHNNSPAVYYECLCKCGKIRKLRASNISKHINTLCRCIRPTGKNHPEYEGYEDISKNVWSVIQRTAKERNLEFDISIEYGWKLFIKQEKRCALTGLPIKFNTTYKNQIDRTASLDRIDSTIGYIEGNVQWVHKLINYFKGNTNNDLVIAIANLIANKNPLEINESIAQFVLTKQTFLRCKSRH